MAPSTGVVTVPGAVPALASPRRQVRRCDQHPVAACLTPEFDSPMPLAASLQVHLALGDSVAVSESQGVACVATRLKVGLIVVPDITVEMIDSEGVSSGCLSDLPCHLPLTPVAGVRSGTDPFVQGETVDGDLPGVGARQRVIRSSDLQVARAVGVRACRGRACRRAILPSVARQCIKGQPAGGTDDGFSLRRWAPHFHRVARSHT